MSTGHVLLGLLSRGQQHGYDLKRQHDAAFPASRPLAPGQLYAALGRLRDRGLVREVAVEQAGGPPRTVYALTDDGRAELEDWMETTEGPGAYTPNPVGTKLTVTLMTEGPQAARRYLDAQRAAHLEQMRAHTVARRAAGGDLAQVLAADHALNHLDADVRWMEEARLRVDELGGNAG